MALGEPFGASWRLLGRSWAPLGASWGALGPIFFGDGKKIVSGGDFGTKKGAKREAFGEPKWHQNRPKIEVENKHIKKMLLGASWVNFGSFWGASWCEKTFKSIGGANIS